MEQPKKSKKILTTRSLSAAQQKEAEDQLLWLNNWNANRIVNGVPLQNGYQIPDTQKVDVGDLNEENRKSNINEITRAEYNPFNDRITLDPTFQEEYGIPAHEYSHRFQKYTEMRTPKTYNNYIKDPINALIPNVDTYQSDQNEIHSELNRLRYNANYKPDQVITPEDVDNVDMSSYNFNGTDKETLVKLLNSTASIDNTNDNLSVAAFGTGKKGTVMKKKKYALGSPGIENPATTIAKNNIMIAEAEQKAQNNPWIPITMMAGQLASTALSSGIGKAGSPTVNPQVQSVNHLQPAGMTPMQNQYINALGNNQAGGNIEVEGEEVIELPTGQVAEVEGASHENGGVDLNVPEGTKIYSKRIEKFGETMAERKTVREKKKLNLDKLLEKGNTDIAIRNAHKRTMQTLEAQEAEDLKTQEMFGMMAAIQEYAYGTNEDGTPKYATGTGLPRPAVGDYQYPNITNNYESYSPELPPPVDINDTSGQGLTLTDLAIANPTPLIPETNIDQPGSVVSRFADTVGNAVAKSGIKAPGTGDMVGLFGDLISTFGPMKNTLANRASDTPNINAFENFGKDALETNLSAMELAASQKDSAVRRITSQANASKRAGRNSARGVNQSRALDLATDINVNEANQSATDSFTRTMQELLGQRTGLENAQDSAVMQGEAGRDLADRQDKDNFSTQLGKDIATQGQGVQQIGKDLNAVKQNEMMSNVINQLSKYGLAFDEKGNLIQKPQTK